MSRQPAQGDNSWLGNMNCYVTSQVRWGRRVVMYNGTTLDLVRQLLAAGAKAGATFTDGMGRKRRLFAQPNDPRGLGHWATSFNLEA